MDIEIMRTGTFTHRKQREGGNLHRAGPPADRRALQSREPVDECPEGQAARQ